MSTTTSPFTSDISQHFPRRVKSLRSVNRKKKEKKEREKKEKEKEKKKGGPEFIISPGQCLCSHIHIT